MGSSELKRILYVSRITLDAGSRLTSTMEDILLESVRNNRRDGISRFLWSDIDEALLAPTDIALDLFTVAPGAILAMLSRVAALRGDQLDRSHRRLLERLGERIP